MICRGLTSQAGTLLLLALFAGCSSELATYPVNGTVLLANGEPLAGATVSMAPVDGSHSATGQTDAAGRFVMGTYHPGDGMPLGTFRAIVVAPVGPDPDQFLAPPFDPRYSSYETSGLEVAIDGAIDDLKIQLD